MKKFRLVITACFFLIGLYAHGQRLTLFSEDCLFGYKNYSGEIVIPAQFKSADPFTEGRASVSYDSLYGCINTKGELVIPAKYQSVGWFLDGFALVKYHNKWGLIDTNGKFVIDAVYNHLDYYTNGCYQFTNGFNRLSGLILVGNKVILEPDKYDFYYLKNNYLYIKDTNNKIGIFEIPEGKIILKPQFDDIYGMSETGLTTVKKGLWGVVNLAGKTIIPFNIDDERKIRLYEHLIAVYQEDSTWKIYNSKGKKLFKKSVQYISDFYSPFLIMATNQKVIIIEDCEKPRAIDTFNNINLGRIKDFYLLLCKNMTDDDYEYNQYYGLFDSNCTLILKPEYENIGYLSDSLGMIQKNEEYGFINDKGEIIFEPQFSLYYETKKGNAWVSKGDKYEEDLKWGLIDQFGNMLIEPELNALPHELGGRYIIQKEGIYGIYDEDMELIKPLNHTVLDADEFYLYTYDSLIAKFGLLTTAGDLVFEPIFDSISLVIHEISKVKLNGLWGLIDKEGNYLIKPAYKYLADCKETLNQYWMGDYDNYFNYTDYSFFQFSDTCLDAFTTKLNNQMIDDALSNYLVDHYIYYYYYDDEQAGIKDINEKYNSYDFQALINELENSNYYTEEYNSVTNSLNYYNCNSNLISYTIDSTYCEGQWCNSNYTITNGIAKGNKVDTIKLKDIFITYPFITQKKSQSNEDIESEEESDEDDYNFTINNPELNLLCKKQLQKSLDENGLFSCLGDDFIVPFTELFEFTEDMFVFYLNYEDSDYDNDDYYKLEIPWDLLKGFIKKESPVYKLTLDK